MKKQLITVVALAGLAAGATMAFAAAGSEGGGIVGSKHDMNIYLGANGDSEQRVCAFCHTPHHAADTAQTTVSPDGSATEYVTYLPLWSRAVPAGPYDSYVTNTFSPTGFYDPLAGPSRLCMSCHDGNIAVDAYYGKAGAVTTSKGDDLINYFGSGHFAIGATNGLSNDHPVGFEYQEMVDNSTGAGATMEINAMTNTFSTGKTIESVLYDLDGSGTKIMTCASCHDVHNGPAVGNTNPNNAGRGYFLLDTQANSALCLVCHNKNS